MDLPLKHAYAAYVHTSEEGIQIYEWTSLLTFIYVVFFFFYICEDSLNERIAVFVCAVTQYWEYFVLNVSWRMIFIFMIWAPMRVCAFT